MQRAGFERWPRQGTCNPVGAIRSPWGASPGWRYRERIAETSRPRNGIAPNADQRCVQTIMHRLSTTSSLSAYLQCCDAAYSLRRKSPSAALQKPDIPARLEDGEF